MYWMELVSKIFGLLWIKQGGESCACHKCHASACPCACHAMHGSLQLFWHVFMFFEEKIFINQPFRSSWRSDRCWLLIKSNLLGTFRKELVLFSNLCQKYDKFWLINSYFFNPLKLFGMSGACACNACHAHAMPCLRFLASFHTLRFLDFSKSQGYHYEAEYSTPLDFDNFSPFWGNCPR